jgi:DNA-directed RNA polymerase subunit beta'
MAKKIDESGIETVEIRSVLTCESKRGVCVNVMVKTLLRVSWHSEVMQ